MFQYLFRKESTFIFLILIGLVLGNIIFYSASVVKSIKEFQSSTYYWWNFFWKTILLGLLIFIFGFFLGYTWPKFKFLISISFLFLILLLFLSLLVSDLKRWITIGSISFQPSEIIKPFVLLFSAYSIVGIKTLFQLPFLRLMVFWLPVLLVVFLIFLQPALSNALIILFASLIVYLTLKPTWKELLVIIFLIFILILSSFFWEYRIERVIAFFKPNLSDRSLQTNLVQQAIISGGFWGKGLGNSEYKIIGIPELLTDSIFAIIGEELGFVGISIILFYYLFLFLYLIRLGQRIELLDGKAFVYGVVAWLSLQTFTHIAGNLGLIPLTGVVLPFFSQGGSAQLAILFSFGIIKGLYEKWS